MEPSARPRLESSLGLTARIVSAYVIANPMERADLPELIRAVGRVLDSAAHEADVPAIEPSKPTPAQIRRSVRPDSLVSFLDGRAYKTLKRHLHRHGLTETDYRARFGLPDDYPMTAPDYRARRSAMAKASGLGHGRRGPS
jgi:predicted transcriptional regulator